MSQYDRGEIEKRAYEIWDREGRPQGKEESHWHRAVAELEREAVERAKAEALLNPLDPPPADEGPQADESPEADASGGGGADAPDKRKKASKASSAAAGKSSAKAAGAAKKSGKTSDKTPEMTKPNRKKKG